ncbi:MAG: amidohydrolase family protein, partial [Acidobacteriota bacterium]
LDLVRWLVSRGHRVSLGHSAADYEQARDAIAAGASQATHLFNRMRPLGHRAPGLVGAVLESTHVAAEVICDGHHVHPALVRMAVAVKGVDHILAVTDGTSLAGRHAPQRGRLGGLAITAGGPTAVLADGTTAGGTSTMDQVFRMLVGRVGLSMPAAAAVTAATPARQLGLAGHGVLAVGAVADLVVLDETLAVVETYIAGRLVYAREATLA